MERKTLDLIELTSGETLPFDRVICTAVPPQVPKLLPTLTDSELDLLNGVTYQGIEGLKLFVAAEFYEGKPWSPFGYFDRNDRVLLGARYEIF
jgi:hypothetical protein